MSPSIEISEQNYQRLKKWAEPLEDSADDALGKVLEIAEAGVSASSNGSQPSAPVDPVAKAASIMAVLRGHGPVRAGFTLNGEQHYTTSAQEVMRLLFEKLADRSPDFLDRFASLPHGRKRRYVARDPNYLFPGRPDLAKRYSREIKPGWWIGVNCSRAQIEEIIKMACQVAGLKFGEDVRIELGE